MKLDELKNPINLNNYQHTYLIYNTDDEWAIDIPTIIEPIDGTTDYILVLINPFGSMAIIATKHSTKEAAIEKRKKFEDSKMFGRYVMQEILLNAALIVGQDPEPDNSNSNDETLN